MTTTSTQIVPKPNNYLTGLNLSLLSTTTLNLSRGQARDSTNSFDIVIPNDLIIDASVDGVNGFYQGELVGNEFYYLFVIGSSLGIRTPGALISSGPINNPLLPPGYDLFRLVGVWRTDGSATFVNTYQLGSGVERTYIYDTSTAVLSGGTQTAFTAVQLFPFVPPIAKTSLLMKANYTPAVAGNEFSLRPTGSASTGTITQKGLVATVIQDTIIKMPALIDGVNNSIDYKVTTADTLNLYVYGYTIPLG